MKDSSVKHEDDEEEEQEREAVIEKEDGGVEKVKRQRGLTLSLRIWRERFLHGKCLMKFQANILFFFFLFFTQFSNLNVSKEKKNREKFPNCF